jgi:hypothetical protein
MPSPPIDHSSVRGVEARVLSEEVRLPSRRVVGDGRTQHELVRPDREARKPIARDLLHECLPRLDPTHLFGAQPIAFEIADLVVGVQNRLHTPQRRIPPRDRTILDQDPPDQICRVANNVDALRHDEHPLPDLWRAAELGWEQMR